MKNWMLVNKIKNNNDILVSFFDTHGKAYNAMYEEWIQHRFLPDDAGVYAIEAKIENNKAVVRWNENIENWQIVNLEKEKDKIINTNEIKN